MQSATAAFVRDPNGPLAQTPTEQWIALAGIMIIAGTVGAIVLAARYYRKS